MVGKGITFDAGGFNLKVNAMIELMKFDMGGGAAVLGAAKLVGMMKPEGVEAHFIVPAAENLIDSTAYRPSDIVTACNGKTIEVVNTDAEGRLILADALIYAESLNVDFIIDIATLTGAQMQALGLKIAAVYSPSEELSQEMKSIGEEVGEPMWPMPLHEEYKKDLESRIADIRNASLGRSFGGSIIAALFLKEFISHTPWVHIDMAGPCWDHKDSQPTGFGTRTLAQFVIGKQMS